MKHLTFYLALSIAACGMLITFSPASSRAATSGNHETHSRLARDIIPTPGSVNTSEDRPTQQLVPTSGLGTILDGLWNRGMRIFYILISIYALVTLTQAALRYGSAQGDAKRVAEARTAIVQTVLGIALLTASIMVVSLIWAFVRVLV